MMNPFDPGYYTDAELGDMGFRSIGRSVQIAKNCVVVGLPNISLGDHVRIDSFCSLLAPGPGCLEIGSYIHIGAYCYLAAGAGITLDDFAGLSQGVRIYSATDDYGGSAMTNPTVPEAYRHVIRGRVHLQRHVIIGSGTVILPGVTVGQGSSVGANSLVNKDLQDWSMYLGCPVRRLKERSRHLLDLELAFRADSQPR